MKKIPPKSESLKKYRFDEMKVGQDKFLKGIDSGGAHARLAMTKLKYGYKFTTRNEKDGVRIWRTE